MTITHQFSPNPSLSAKDFDVSAAARTSNGAGKFARDAKELLRNAYR
ncbi:MAG TPA: hypothetical protein VFE47_07595 [Tepidisphaeraceae bacterium]|nr:hypothetical protein [Tepidisphaeraceae bacterium]